MTNSSDDSVSIPAEFEASSVNKAVNVFWFSSLMLSIFAALFGIFVKQWMHTYHSWSQMGSPKEAVELRSIYHNSLFAWHVSEILSVLPLLLQLALVFFIIGLVAYLWTLDTVVAIFATTFALVGGVAVLATVSLPVWYKDCAYKSPLSLFILRWSRQVQDSKWRLYDMNRAREARPKDAVADPCLLLSRDLEHLLNITPANSGESLLDRSIVFTRVKALELYAENFPFQLLHILLSQASKTVLIPYTGTPPSIWGIVEVLYALTCSESYLLQPHIASGLVAHFCHWKPRFPLSNDIADQSLSTLQMLCGILLQHFRANSKQLDEAGSQMLLQCLDQWALLCILDLSSSQNVATGARKFLEDLTKTNLVLQTSFNPPLSPSTMSHNALVTDTSWSSNGVYIAVGLYNGKVVVWHAHSRRHVMVLQSSKYPVWSVAFSPNSKLIAAASQDKSIYIWDINTPARVQILKGHTDQVHSCVFSADSAYAVSGSQDCTVRVWGLRNSTENGKSTELTGHDRWVYSVACSPNELYIISGSLDCTIRLWDAKRQLCIRTLRGHTNAVVSVAFAHNSLFIVSGSLDRTARLWDAETGAQLHIFKGTDIVRSVAFSPQGGYILSGACNRTAQVWSTCTGVSLRALDGRTSRACAVSFSPDGKSVVSSLDDHNLKIWDVNLPAVLTRLEDLTDEWQQIAFSHDGTQIVFVNGSNAGVWDATTGKHISFYISHSDDVLCASFSYNGVYLVTGSADTTARIWNPRTGWLLQTLAGHESDIRAVSFSCDGTLIVTGSDDLTVRLWNVSNGESVKLDGHTGAVLSVAVSDSGKYIASGSDDKTVRIWNSRTRQSLAVHGHGNSVRSVTFSPNEQQVATGSNDCTVQVWDAEKGKRLTILRGHKASVASVAFSSTGAYITSIDENGEVRAWGAPHNLPHNSAAFRKLLVPGMPIFTFESDSGWILGCRYPETTPKRLFWVAPQLRPASRLWSHEYRVILRAASGVTTVLIFESCHI